MVTMDDLYGDGTDHEARHRMSMSITLVALLMLGLALSILFVTAGIVTGVSGITTGGLALLGGVIVTLWVGRKV